MKVLPYIVYLIFIALWVVILRDLTSVYYASINLPALIVLLVALYKSDLTAAWFGFWAGLVGAAATPQLMGWQTLIMVVLALAGSLAKVRLNLDSLKAKLCLVGGGVLLHNVITLAISQSQDFPFLLLASAITGVLYTCVAAWLFFLLKEGLITYEKVKSIL
jgi:hypothetical protein